MATSPGYGERLLVAPTWEPVTAGQIVAGSRLLYAEADLATIAEYITAAREWVETRTHRALPQQQWQLTFDEFPGRQVDDYRPPTWRYGIVRLPRAPLISVDSVQYVDPGQSTQPFTYTTLSPTADYQVDTNTQPGRLAPAPFVVWPATNPLAMQAVRIAYTAGYASADLVPWRLKQGIRMLVAHLYENREGTAEVALQRVPFGIVSFITAAATWEYT